VEQALDRCLAFGPDLVFYLAGADPYRDDRLGRLAVSPTGLAARDRRVIEGCRRSNVPVAVVMGGGYARVVDDTVDIHFTTVATAVASTPRQQSASRTSL
jgi:acetoin utilization deacetylase AcuC-like enzyme